jgi:hypothetical protein
MCVCVKWNIKQPKKWWHIYTYIYIKYDLAFVKWNNSKML